MSLPPAQLVRLNVGGRTLLSTRATLTSHPGSALAAMFDPDSGRPPALRDEDTGGAYFLDRNPDAFEVILEFLRTDKLFNPRGLDPDRIRAEADFFGLESLLELLDAKAAPYPLPPKKVVVFSVHKKRLVHVGHVRPDGAFQHTRWDNLWTPVGQVVPRRLSFKELKEVNIFFTQDVCSLCATSAVESGLEAGTRLANLIADNVDAYYYEEDASDEGLT